jgi:DNA-binding NarL/FixJ family response regulator
MPYRVLIVSRNRLLAHGLESLIARYQDIQVVGAISAVSHLPQAVKDLTPDAVIVEGDLSRLHKVIDTLSGVRVLAMTLDANALDVYERQHVDVAGVQELVAAITGKTGPVKCDDGLLALEEK